MAVSFSAQLKNPFTLSLFLLLLLPLLLFSLFTVKQSVPVFSLLSLSASSNLSRKAALNLLHSHYSLSLPPPPPLEEESFISPSLFPLPLREDSAAGEEEDSGEDDGSTSPLSPPSEQSQISVLHPSASLPFEPEVELKKDPESAAVETGDAKNCDLYKGTWVRDEEGRYPLYPPGSCPYVDEAFDCQANGRQDDEYLKWRWKPEDCELPSIISLTLPDILRNIELRFISRWISWMKGYFGSLLSRCSVTGMLMLLDANVYLVRIIFCEDVRIYFPMLLWHHLYMKFNASDFLERLRGKRLMIVGDSINRNQFESMLCILREALPDKSRMYETHGYKISKGRGFYVFLFMDYNCTISFVRSHFLAREAKLKSKPILMIDRICKTSPRWTRADILVFNTGHWWTHGKTSRGNNYYKEGDVIYPHFDATEAFKKSMQTWGKWIDKNLNPSKTLIFYRGYSTAHFRGGDWDSGGTCNGETSPALTGSIIDNYPSRMKILEEVKERMSFPLIFLNVTRLTNFRKDGHPSIYGKRVVKGEKVSKRGQDCSHWCLPGIPDTWNELIYANLVLKQI